MARKVELLIRHFGTQRSKHWFDEETFRGLARLRAMECRAPERYAEAFYARKDAAGVGNFQAMLQRARLKRRTRMQSVGNRRSEKLIFTETKLKGAFIIDLDRKEDARGFFARAFCQEEFKAHGLKPVIAQANIALQSPQGHASAACISSIRRPPRPSSCAARAARSSTSSSICARKARPICSISRSS